MELTRYVSPLGTIFLAADNGALAGLWLEGQKYFAATLDEAAVERDDLPVFRQAAAWLDAYFAKQPLPDLPPLAPRGSDFRQAVWRLLLEIPYGQVTTYGALPRFSGTEEFPLRPRRSAARWGTTPFLSSSPVTG